MAKDVEFLKTELSQLQAALSKVGDIQIVGDINANFVLFRTQKKNELMKHLVDNKVLIRDQSKQIALENCLRISIGDKAQNQTLLALITAFFANEAK